MSIGKGVLNMNDELLRRSIDEIIRSADEAKGEPNSELRDGQLLAYNEVLSILQTNLTTAGPERFGLDFDIDKRFA
jgi:hypothetical protein